MNKEILTSYKFSIYFLVNPNRNVSAGECAKAFVLIGLGFIQRALYLTTQHLSYTSLDKLCLTLRV